MLKFAVKRSALATKSIASRFYSTTSSNTVARQMFSYAHGHARFEKSGETYAQATMILEQGMSNLGGGDSSEDTMGIFMLAMSTLLYERGKLQDVVDKLQMAYMFEYTSPAVKVAALEGLIGLNLEAGEDVASSAIADDCFKLLNDIPEDSMSSYAVVKSRAKAAKAESLFDGFQDCNLEDNKDQMGNASFSNGVFLHATGYFSVAKDLYKKILQVFEANNIAESSYLASANMVSEEVLLGVTSALGQLLSHSGKFGEAEDLLTKALTKAEEHFGPTHPKVGVVLTCIAMMFKYKAKLEATSAILIQEGFYRRAIDLLKAPAIDSEVADMQVAKRDIVALARVDMETS